MRLTVLLTLILFLSSCLSNNKKNENIQDKSIDLNYNDNISQLSIKTVDKISKKTTSTTNHPNTSLIDVKSNCCTLQEIIDLTLKDSKQFVHIENKALDKEYFQFKLQNSSPGSVRDSVILYLLASQIGFTIEETKIPIKHVKITIADQEKFDTFVNTIQSDTITQKRSVTKLYYKYENMSFDKIISDMSEHFNKIISFDENENPRIDFQFRCNHWAETTVDLQDKMGLKLTTTTVMRTQYTIN